MFKKIAPWLVVAACSLGAVTEAQEGPPTPQNPEQMQEEFQAAFDFGLDAIRDKKYKAAVRAFTRCVAIFPERPTAYYNLACCYSLMANKAEAMKWTEEALKRGFDGFEHMVRDTDLDNIRKEPEFIALVERYRKKLIEGRKSQSGALYFGVRGERQALVVFLHGNGQSPADYRAWKGWAERAGVGLLLLPGTDEIRGQRGWGSSAETVVLEDVKAAIKTYGADPARVLAAGFSTGAYQALSLGLRHPSVFRGVIAFSPYYERSELDASLAKAKNLRVFMTTGRDDPVSDSAREGRDAMVEGGLKVVLRRFDGGHALPGKPEQELTAGLRWVCENERPGAGRRRAF
jgi:pimeloyl-ACP methyl ester carboxylesterase